MHAIHSVVNGEAIFSPKVAERLITYFGKQRAAKTPAAFSDLTERECEVLELITQGLTNTAIAERLILSPKNRAQSRLQYLQQAAGL